MENRKLKVLFLTEYFYPYTPGGSEWSVFYLAKNLRNQNVDVGIYTPNYGGGSYSIWEKIKIFRFPIVFPKGSLSKSLSPFWHTNTLWWIISSLFLWKTAKQFQPSHIHVQSKYLLPAGIIVGKLLKLPVIVTLRDYLILCPHGYCIRRGRNFRACSFRELVTEEFLLAIERQNVKGLEPRIILFFATIRGWWITHLLKFFLNQVDYVIGISNRLEQVYRQNRISVDQVMYNVMEFNGRGTSKQNFWFFAGRKTWGKGIDLLLKAYNHVSKKKSFPPLYIVGQGAHNRNNRNTNVKFISHLSHAQYLEYLRKAKLVIVPSRWEEPFGRVALEALSHGTPVVATDRGGLPEIVEHNKTGIIIEPTVSDLSKGLQLFLDRERALNKYLRKEYYSLKQKFFYKPLTAHVLLYQNL